MDRVNIMTVTTCKGPARQSATGMWMIEHIHDGIPNTKHGFLKREKITSKELSLQLLTNAMYTVKAAKADFDSIEIYSDEPYVVAAFENKWVEKWDKNNWMASRGNEVAFVDTWKMILKLMNESGKRFIFSTAQSSYENWMRLQIDLEGKKKND